jgi:hypothetical protein
LNALEIILLIIFFAEISEEKDDRVIATELTAYIENVVKI